MPASAPTRSTGLPRRADLPDHFLRLRGHRSRRRPLRPQPLRQHLHADHEPHHRRLRGAHGGLEGGVGALATASGLAAQLIAITTLLEAGRPHRRLAPPLRRQPQPALHHAAPVRHRDDVRRPRRPGEPGAPPSRRARACSTARRSATRASTCSTSRPSPRWRTRRACPLLIDNTFATPYLCRPIEHGAHLCRTRRPSGSAGTARASAACWSTRGTFPWAEGLFPGLVEPSPGYRGMRFAETFGNFAFIMKARVETMRDLGPVLSPFNSFLLLQGLETLSLRMDRHVDNARAVADFLAGPPGRGVGELPRPARTAPSAPGPRATCRAAPARCSPSACGRPRGGAAADRGLRALLPPGQRGRRQDAHHPPRLHHPPPARRGGPRRAPASPTTWSASRSAWRRSTTSSGTSTRRSGAPPPDGRGRRRQAAGWMTSPGNGPGGLRAI